MIYPTREAELEHKISRAIIILKRIRDYDERLHISWYEPTVSERVQDLIDELERRDS